MPVSITASPSETHLLEWLAIALTPVLGPTRVRKLVGCGVFRHAYLCTRPLLSKIVMCVLSLAMCQTRIRGA